MLCVAEAANFGGLFKTFPDARDDAKGTMGIARTTPK